MTPPTRFPKIHLFWYPYPSKGKLPKNNAVFRNFFLNVFGQSDFGLSTPNPPPVSKDYYGMSRVAVLLLVLSNIRKCQKISKAVDNILESWLIWVINTMVDNMFGKWIIWQCLSACLCLSFDCLIRSPPLSALTQHNTTNGCNNIMIHGKRHCPHTTNGRTLDEW